MTLLRSAFLIVSAVASMAAMAQPATPAQRAGVPAKDSHTMHFRSQVGSFKMLDGRGRVEIEFTGTLLLNNYQGASPVVQGNVRVEYDNPQRKRRVYFGVGRIVLNGTWRGVQVFGRNLRAVWFGRGVVRLSGEFDRNLETGWYWYDDPNDRTPWPSQGVQDVMLPPFRVGPSVTPRARDEVKRP